MTRDIIIRLMLALALLTSATMLRAQNNEEEKTPEEMAAEEANRLEKLLKLEPHQTFYIDSILQHDMRALYDEVESLRASGTQEYTAYKQVQDKWKDQVDSSYKKVLTEYQYMIYRRDIGKLSKEELKTLKAMEKAEKKPARQKRTKLRRQTAKAVYNRVGGLYSKPHT